MTTKIKDLKDGQWYDIEVGVLQIWDNDHPAIRQVGIVKDDTGIVKFVSWEKSNLPLMEIEGKYCISNVVVSSYGDQLQIALNATSVIERMGGVQSEIPTV